jgi:phospholipid/cholesterol/gamma-HCH transport system permease protein
MADDAHIDAQRGPDGTLVIRLAGRWSLRTGLPSTRPVEDALAQGTKPTAVAFDAKDLAGWDSAAVTVVERIDRLCARLGVQVRRDELPDGLKRILALADAVPEKEGARAGDAEPPWLVRLGLGALATATGARVAVAFVGDATLSFGRFVRGQANFRGRDLALVVQDCGAQALPIVTLINFLVGLIIAFVGAVQLQKFGAGIYVADLVAIATVRELGCIMTGIIMAGRTGSGFAAQLGTMNVNQEIEALSTMGVPAMDFLVLPRILALSLMMPLLCCYADLIAILGGATVGINMLGQSPTQYWVETRGALGLVDVGLGIGKGMIFGVLVALAGCLRGMTCGRDAAAVGQAATSAVVLGIVWIIVTDGIFAVLTNILGI